MTDDGFKITLTEAEYARVMVKLEQGDFQSIPWAAPRSVYLVNDSQKLCLPTITHGA
jgi:hypothetical protein